MPRHPDEDAGFIAGLRSAAGRTDAPDAPSLLQRVAKYAVTVLLSAAVGYLGALATFSTRLDRLEDSQQDFLYILCNTTVPERALGLVRPCRGVERDAQLRAFSRDTT